MNLVWKAAPYQGNTLLALLALADWSDDLGVSWPAVETLAKKSRQSERQAQRVIHRLQTDGFLRIMPRKGTSSKYVINIHRLEGRQNVTPTRATKGVTFTAKTVSQMSPNTSIEPSVDSNVRGSAPKFSQSDFDERDWRLLTRELGLLRQSSIGTDRTAEEIFDRACNLAGLSKNRGREVAEKMLA